MSLLPRFRSSRDREENQALQQRVSSLQSALAQCKEMAGRWSSFRREVSIGIAIVLVGLGFTLGVYRDSIKETGGSVARAIGLAGAPSLEAAGAYYREGE